MFPPEFAQAAYYQSYNNVHPKTDTETQLYEDNSHMQNNPMLMNPPTDRFAQMSLNQQNAYPSHYPAAPGTAPPPHPPHNPTSLPQQMDPSFYHQPHLQHTSQPSQLYNSPLSNNVQSPYYPPSGPQMASQQPQYSSSQPPQQNPLTPPFPPMPQHANQQNYPSQTVPSIGQQTPQYAAGLHMPPMDRRGTYQPSVPASFPNAPGAPVMPGQPQPSRKVSRDALPNIIQVIEKDRTQCVEPFYTNQKGKLPPLVSTDFTCRDEGNCNPRFVRSSLYAVPTTAELVKSVGVPFTLTISPFANLHPEDQPIMISDFGPEGPVRCSRCHAYMSPFVSFIDGGRRFQCPLCNVVTAVPDQYFAHLDHTGRRMDTFQRPELCLGSYDLLATAKYCKEEKLPQAPAFIFILDVSQASLSSGLVSLFCSKFGEYILPNLPREEYEAEGTPSAIKLGFITYDHQLHFYTLGRDTGGSRDDTVQENGQSTAHTTDCQPQVHVVADVEDVFVPAVDGFLISPDPAAITRLLHLIPNQFYTSAGQSQGTADAVLGSAIQAGVEALKAADRPGKLFVMHANLPTAEAPGKLKNRDDRRLIGTDKEKTLLQPAGDFYTGLGQMCIKVGCSVDLFLFPTAFVDVSTLAEVPRLTGGHIYKYNCFQADLQGNQFLSDLAFAFSLPKAFDAVMRVRTSAGIRPVEFYGNCNIPNTSDIELCVVDSKTAITVEIRHDDKLQDNDLAYIQVACLFTSVSGQRRIRIHNLSLMTTSAVVDIFRLAELDTHMNFVGKVAMRALCNRAHPHVVDELTARTAHTLAAYRRYTISGSGNMATNPSEFIFPTTMVLFPLYVQCLMKTDAFMPADNISIDDRSMAMFRFNSMDVKASAAFLYPRMYPVHELASNCEGNSFYPPMAVRCSYESLSPDGAYILENGVHLLLWMGIKLPEEWIQSVFNVASMRLLEPERIYELPRLNNETSRTLCSLVDQIHQEHCCSMRILVVRQGDNMEALFKRFMVEDGNFRNLVSYVDYVCHIHKEVTALLR